MPGDSNQKIRITSSCLYLSASLFVLLKIDSLWLIKEERKRNVFESNTRELDSARIKSSRVRTSRNVGVGVDV